MKKNQIAMVTGASSGIGKECARQFAAAGFDVIMVCRDPERAEAARQDISPDAEGNLTVEIADLAALDDVRELASSLRERLDKLDVLVNNAGVFPWRREVSRDGFELQFAVHHLAHFLLTNLMLELLEAAPAARVVTVASDGHKWGRIHWDDLNLQRQRFDNPFVAYGQSKLANILFNLELSRRTAHKGIVANSFTPVLAATNIVNLPRWANRLVELTWPPASAGAEPAIRLATAPEFAEITGGYFKRTKRVKPARLAQDDEDARILWRVSERLVGLDSASWQTNDSHRCSVSKTALDSVFNKNGAEA